MSEHLLFPYDMNAVFFSMFTKWRISNWSLIGRYNRQRIRWPCEHVTRREKVYHCCCDCFIFTETTTFVFLNMNDGCILQNGFNTIIVNVFLSTKLNDNHQVDTVDVFQSKDFVVFWLPCTFFTYCIGGNVDTSLCCVHCVKPPAREAANERKH